MSIPQIIIIVWLIILALKTPISNKEAFAIERDIVYARIFRIFQALHSALVTIVLWWGGFFK